MAEKSIIRVNKNKPTTVDFDLTIEGIDNKKKTIVRLVVENVVNGCDISIAATQSSAGQWSVKIPNLKNFEDDTYEVFLEVVVDGYHFIPATGQLELVNEPTVKIVTEQDVTGDVVSTNDASETSYKLMKLTSADYRKSQSITETIKPKLNGIMTRKTKAEKLADPVYVAEMEKNSNRVRKILGII